MGVLDATNSTGRRKITGITYGMHRCKVNILEPTQWTQLGLKEVMKKLGSKNDLFWRNVSLFLHPIVVHKDVCLCCWCRGTFDHIWQQLPNFWSRPDVESPFTLLWSSRRGGRVCILCAVEPPRLFRTIWQKRNERRGWIMLISNL